MYLIIKPGIKPFDKQSGEDVITYANDMKKLQGSVLPYVPVAGNDYQYVTPGLIPTKDFVKWRRKALADSRGQSNPHAEWYWKEEWVILINKGFWRCVGISNLIINLTNGSPEYPILIYQDIFPNPFIWVRSSEETYVDEDGVQWNKDSVHLIHLHQLFSLLEYRFKSTANVLRFLFSLEVD